MKKIVAFLKDESGATAIEYGLIAALISVAAILAMRYVGNELQQTFNTVAAQLDYGQQQATSTTTGGR